jgi:hypothetical protein
MNLTIKQTRAIEYLEDDETNEVLFGGGAGGGKSAFGCYWLIKNSLKYAGSRWLMGRSELKTLKETTLVTFFEIASKNGLLSRVHYNFNQQSNVISFPNGSTIICKDLFQYPSDPNFDSLGSLEITGAFIDECNQITSKAKEVVGSRIRFKLDEFGLIPKILMSCNPAKNWVYNQFYKPSKDGSISNKRKFVQALATDNANISKHYVENLRQMSEVSKQRLLYGNWEYDDSLDILIPYDSILNLYSNKVEPGQKYITADIARFGNDKTVIIAWDGWNVIEIKVLGMSSIPESVESIKSLMQKYNVPLSNVVVDEDGVGGGVKDILFCHGFVNGSSPIINLSNNIGGQKEQYQNLKSQCYYKFADQVVSGNCSIGIPLSYEIKDKINEELSWVKRHNIDKDGKLAVLPKEKVKEGLGRSPDFSDALMMRKYFDIMPKRTRYYA